MARVDQYFWLGALAFGLAQPHGTIRGGATRYVGSAVAAAVAHGQIVLLRYWFHARTHEERNGGKDDVRVMLARRTGRPMIA